MDNGKSPDDLSEVMDFSSFDLRTTIRLIVMSGESRRVEVRRGTKSGAIYVKDGEIYRAESHQRQGDEAFFEILSWDKTIHADFRQLELPEHNVLIPTHVLIDLLKKDKVRP
jgi:hypothetical protein